LLDRFASPLSLPFPLCVQVSLPQHAVRRCCFAVAELQQLGNEAVFVGVVPTVIGYCAQISRLQNWRRCRD